MTALLAAAVAGRGARRSGRAGLLPRRRGPAPGRGGIRDGRIRGGRPVLLRLHVERLERSAPGAPAAAAGGRAALARQAAEAAGTDEGVLRLFRTGRTLLATVGAAAARPRRELRARGIAVVTVRSHDTGLLTGVKATSYATALAAVAQAEQRGAEDAIYLGEGETVLEATMSNVWWREEDVLVTPSLSTGVLPGVTRGAVAAIARRAGYRDPRGIVPAAGAARGRRGVHELCGARDRAGRRGRRPRAPRGEAASRLQAMLEQVTDEYPAGDGESGGRGARLRRSGSEGWRSRTACSSTARPPGPVRCVRTTAS